MDTGEYGPNKEIAVVNLKKALKEHYREVKEPYKIHGKLTMERIKTSADWPKLKAQAAPTRRCNLFAIKLARKHNSQSTHDKRRLAVVTLLDRFY